MTAARNWPNGTNSSLNTLPQEQQGLPYGTLISQEVHQRQNEEFRVSDFAQNYTDKAYFHQDHLGSTTKISGEDPTNAFRWDYTPMGEAYGFKHRYSHEQMTRTHVGHSPKRNLVPYLYQGKYETNLTGAIQMDARWYQPKLGRWLQPDYYNFAQLSLPKGARQQLLASTSLNTQGLLRDPSQQMRYGYVSGNPLRWVDPLGLQQWSKEEVMNILDSTPTGSVLVPLVSEDIKWEGSQVTGNRTASYIPSTNTIIINDSYTSLQAAPVAAHELFHAIQDVERERNSRIPSKDEILIEEVTAKNVGLNVWNELGKPIAPYDSTYMRADALRSQSQEKHDEMWYKAYEQAYKNRQFNFKDLIEYEVDC